jgi:hypothetical protein
MQIFFILAPSCKILPKDTVCVSYIKTRSLSQFTQKITQLMESGEPAEGIFQISFLSHQNGKGDPYKSVKFDWRPRKSAEEKKQLDMIANFVQTQPPLGDSNGTREMIRAIVHADVIAPDSIEVRQLASSSVIPKSWQSFKTAPTNLPRT